jgi:hypothetical protein
MGQLYLTNVDFLKNGVPASIMAAAVNVFSLDAGIVLTNRVGRSYSRFRSDESYRVCIVF